ncbi:hypothetical protein ACQPXB_36140 [Amycolatopsis sp. CA-161197]|uniref:hypothetical protein n=1 Tax=Amycolatopsis sp. CA-161197 TaxID=3239922 RepID=UPI003D8F6174
MLDHAEAHMEIPNRAATVAIAGAPTVRLRDDDVFAFRAWVASLAQRSPVHSEVGTNRAVLSVVGLIRCGKRVSVTVDVRADLLRRNELAGFISAHELARLAPLVVTS